MSDRPILFSGPMVRALLAGRKTQTRRALRVQPEFAATGAHDRRLGGKAAWWEYWCAGNPRTIPFRMPFVTGDRLWVREAWARVGDADDDIHACPDLRVHAYYRADAVDPERQRWRPSIHMPRWASRLTLDVTDVRVERLADLTAEDAIAEGVCTFTEGLDRGAPWGEMEPADRAMMVRNTYGSAVTAYHHLWETINGADSWDRNPWVVALTFAVQRKNIAELDHVVAGTQSVSRRSIQA